jgi:3-phosphoshikimate 1-carboxyvinyltransferase
MNLTIHPGHPLRGEVRLPGDKSLSHRAALFAALALGESQAKNFLVSGVTAAMLRALTALGVHWNLEGTTLTVQGRGLNGLLPPKAAVDCGNSATTFRLLAGALAGAGIVAELDGSAGLRRRPMDRIVEPLRQMGVAIEAGPGNCAPLHLAGRQPGERLRAIEYTLPVASAQVKTCLMLAALAGDGVTTLIEPSLSRDHSERMLASQGAGIETYATPGGPAVRVSGLTRDLTPFRMEIPGDFSAAAFLLVAGLITPGSELLLHNIGLNPTRTGLLVSLQEMGADIEILNPRSASGEPAGDLRVRHSSLHGITVNGARVVDMIDEFPVFAAAAAFAQGRTEVCEASELRYKESDRISALCGELRAQGVDVTEKPDGFIINGLGSVTGGAPVNPHGDHRLAMSLAVLGLGSQQPVEVTGAEIIAESFPEFVDVLRGAGARFDSGNGA